VFETFKSFAISAQNQFEFYIKKVRSDNERNSKMLELMNIEMTRV
jgi:hypothetical protein